MSLPDPIERMQMRMDDMAHEQLAGVHDGMIRCYGCKKIVPFNDVESLSPNPDAPAFCFACVGEYYKSQGVSP